MKKEEEERKKKKKVSIYALLQNFSFPSNTHISLSFDVLLVFIFFSFILFSFIYLCIYLKGKKYDLLRFYVQ